uniref:IRF tryptophan pentad repeat domain-containing protein n=1 Tax=Denticeps clupeoides TaxID=299321 RepID=A0AAY4CTL7_9TELE
MDADAVRAAPGGKLRRWLIEQVDSGRYRGLVWDSEDRSVFRVPWKHAGKQDYNRDEDAALFKAWALFKGKYREGVDKPDPPTWKTRLRCLVSRSQLDRGRTRTRFTASCRRERGEVRTRRRRT